MDIVEVARIKRALGNDRFRERVYTPGEIEYCAARGAGYAQSYAARFAGKEAIMKAFGTGLRGGKLTDMEILPDELGCPQVHLGGYFAQLARERGVKRIWISLSHTREYGVAQCVMEGE